MNEQLAISVHAPWAWAILHAGKDVENRSPGFPRRRNSTEVLGDVWVHASLFPGCGPLAVGGNSRKHELMRKESTLMLNTWATATGLTTADDLDLSETPRWSDLDAMRGHIVGRVTVTGFRNPGDPPDSPWYIPGSVAVMLSNPRPLARPVPTRGALGWWSVPADVLAELEAA